MGRNKRNSAMWIRPAVLAVLLTVSLLLGVGAAWARYQTNLVTYADYSAASAESVFLWSSMETAVDGNSRVVTFDKAPGRWEKDPATGEAALYFHVSNGESSESYAAENMAVRIRLTASLGAALPEEGEAGIMLTVDGVPYTAAVQKLDEDSPIYQTVGAGWMISFVDDKGEEARWTLEGGHLSVLDGMISVEEMELAGMMTLQVSGEVAR